MCVCVFINKYIDVLRIFLWDSDKMKKEKKVYKMNLSADEERLNERV